MVNEINDIKDGVKDYYGKTLKSGEDLKTNACCTITEYPDHIKNALANIHPEVLDKYYGCGLTIPPLLTGLKVLDLGCGAGRDCFILSQLIGENGTVYGVDMTDEQLNIANLHNDYHTEKFNFTKSNTHFIKGDIENLAALDFTPASLDLIVSNCVINLATNKQAVLSDAFSMLKDGGELYFSDVYSDRRIPSELLNDQVLYGECLSGALYYKDFISLAKQVGFEDPRLVEVDEITIQNDDVQKKLGNIRFQSLTYRLIKTKDLALTHENYGTQAKYLGTMLESPAEFQLDLDTTFIKDDLKDIDENTYQILKQSRYAEHFTFSTPCKKIHLGDARINVTANPFALATEKINKSTGCCG